MNSIGFGFGFGFGNNLHTQGGVLNGFPAILKDGNTFGIFDFKKEITTVSGKVTKWTDSFLRVNHIDAVTGLEPTITETGVSFISGKILSSAFDYPQPSTIYIVLKQNTWASGKIILDGINPKSAWLYQRTASPKLNINAGSALSVDNDNLPIEKYGLIVMKLLTTQSYLEINGIRTTGNPGNASLGGIKLGNSNGTSFEVKEFIPRLSSDSETNIGIIKNYLLTKYKDDLITYAFDFTSTATTINSNFSVYGETRLAGLYALYDELVTAFPTYITKTLLGNESTGLPIYRYDFAPANSKGKMLYTAIHGSEVDGIAVGVRFFQELCVSESAIMTNLRSNYTFSVIPALNPFAINNQQRKNANGVDLNRNFPNGWILTDVESETYGGSEPLSEVESQLIYNILESETFIFSVDHHNAQLYYNVPPNVEGRGMYAFYKGYTDGMRDLVSFVADKFNGSFEELSFINDVGINHFGNYPKESGYYGGYLVDHFTNPGILIETMFGWGAGAPESATQEVLQKLYTETLAFAFYMAGKRFHT